jgi:hypothetical protein
MNILADEHIKKTRKEHKCWGCLKIIPIGGKARKITNVDNGALVSSYWCDVCDAFTYELDAYELDDGFSEGELREFEGYKEFVSDYMKGGGK